MNVGVYITGHGYGHAARTCDLITSLLVLQPDWVFRIVSPLPEDFLQGRLPVTNRITIERRFTDGGLVQVDGVTADLKASAEELSKVMNNWTGFVSREYDWLARESVGLVLADAPAIPLTAAREQGVPSVTLANFGWDCIYEAYAGTAPIWELAVKTYQSAYQHCDLLLEYPWATPMKSFPRRKRIGTVAPGGTRRRDALCARLQVPTSERLVLLAFTALSWPDAVLQVLNSLPGTTVFTDLPLDLRAYGIPCVASAWPFRDLVASADVVISKPGFGIFSDCARAGVPILAVERPDFSEAAFLMRGLGRNLAGRRFSMDELTLEGFPRMLDDVTQPTVLPEPVPADGAETVSDILMELLQGNERG